MNNFNQYNFSSNQTIKEESFNRILKILGFLFLISFFFPVYFYDKLFFLNIYLLNETKLRDNLPALILLLPAIYGLLILVLPAFLKNKNLSITLFLISAAPFVYLFIKTYSLEKYLSSFHIFGGLWFLLLSTILMFISVYNYADSSRSMLIKIIGLIGAVSFLVHLFFPHEMELGRQGSEKMLLLEMPFKLIGSELVFTGIMILTFYFLISVVAVRLIIVISNNDPSNSNYGKITLRLFTSAWLIYLIGMLFAFFGDIAVESANSGSPPPAFFFATTTIYLKTILSFAPFVILLMFATSKLISDFLSDTLKSNFSTTNEKFNSDSYNSEFYVNNSDPAYSRRNYSQSHNQKLLGSISIDIGDIIASIFVNGIKVSSNGSCRVNGLSPGEYLISVEGKDCYSEEESVFLEPDINSLTMKPKIHLFGKLIIKSEYENISFHSGNGDLLRCEQVTALRAGKHKIKPSKEYLPTLEITISEGKEIVVNYDTYVPKSKLILKNEYKSSDVEIIHQDTGKSNILNLFGSNSITILPGIIKIIVKHGKTKITKKIIVHSKEYLLDLTEDARYVRKRSLWTKILLFSGLTIAVVTPLLVIMLTVWQENDAWTNAKEINTEQSYKEYLTNYPDGKYIQEAKQSMEQTFWTETKQENTEEAYSNFIAKYPDGFYTKEARKLLEPIYWERIKSGDTEDGYNAYLNKFPNGQYREQANISLKLSEANLRNFVRTIINCENERDILTLLDYYSDRVNYFNSGYVNKNFIIQDKQNYFRKWDKTNYTFTDNIDVEKTDDSTAKNVKYNLGFYVFNSETNLLIEGISQNSLVIKYENGSLKIIQQKGKVLSQVKTELEQSNY